MNVWNNISHAFETAFDPAQHGIFSGNWNDFQLGVNRAVGLVPNAISGTISSNVDTYSQAVGRAATNMLSPLNYSPSFYILAGGGILLLLIIGYVLLKI